MLDRLSPFLVLLLNQFLLGFVPLFGLAAASNEVLPTLGSSMGALFIWSIPDLVRLQRSARSEARAPLLFKAVVRSVAEGYVVLAIVLAAAGIASIFLKPFPWHLAGFAAFLVAGFVEARKLRRQLDNLSVLDS